MTRTRWLIPLGGAAVVGGIAYGCATQRQSGAPRSHGLPTPLVASAAAEAAATGEPDREAISLEAFRPLLALPSLAEAARALEDDDPAAAAKAVEAAMEATPPGRGDAVRWQLLLGRLREEAGDLAGAAEAYELAAAEPWPLDAYARLGAGRVLLQSGLPEQALERLRQVPGDQPIVSRARLLAARAAQKLGQDDLAIETWRAYLEQKPRAAEWAAVSLHLARALLERLDAASAGDDDAGADNAVEALRLARHVALEAAAQSEAAAEARELEARALALLPADRRAHHARPSPEDELVRIRTLLDGGKASDAVAVAEGLVAALPAKTRWDAVGCEAGFLRGKGIAAERRWGRASELLADVARLCKDDDLRARSLYLAGRYADYDKRYTMAIKHYEALEREVPDHRLADDARLLAALDYQRIGVEARFTQLLQRMPDDYPTGDMVLDGVFHLALRRIEKGDWAGAASVLERGAKLAAPRDALRGHEYAGRERYFLARAWSETGERDRGAAEYEAIIRELPLSYYMLHAYSRLLAIDAARARRARQEALELSESQPFTFPHRPEFEEPGFARALELLRQGNTESAKAEFHELGLVSPKAAPSLLWSIALLYARAGSAKLSHAVARGLLTDWLERWPAGDWVKAWQLAFPRPYERLVAAHAQKQGVPEYLVYAVMREESAFDPEAVSPSNAYGLMQIIPPTARHFAKQIGVPHDVHSLKRPRVNIALGCRVLGKFTEQFEKNPLLAIPGYNAGPGRPRRWLSTHPTPDFDVWVELIPFRETNRYTKRVLASRAAYAFLYHPPEVAEAAMALPLRLSR